MRKARIILLLIVIGLIELLALTMGVQASSSIFIVEPLTEVIQKVQVTEGVQSIAGNVSVTEGVIDFYITDPLGASVLCFQNVSLKDFEIVTPRNGTYVIHLANRVSMNNVTATLVWSKNLVFVLTSEMTVEHSR